MGVYNTVWVPCPKCRHKEGFQSKSGDCFLYDYELNEAPVEVLMNVNRHAPATCEKCGTKFYVAFSMKINNLKTEISKVESMEYEGDEDK